MSNLSKDITIVESSESLDTDEEDLLFVSLVDVGLLRNRSMKLRYLKYLETHKNSNNG